jgi:hypothetical protein
MNERASPKDPLDILIGPITRSETKSIQKELIGLILDIWINNLQIFQTRPLCTIWDIYKAIREILLRF